MKKYLLAMTLLFALGANAPATAQTQQKRQQQELVDSSMQDEFEAFSDTTLADADSAVNRAIQMGDDWDDWDDEDTKANIDQLLKEVNVDDLAGMAFALVVILIIFVFSPLIIFGLLLYFIFRNRKQKMKLAEMAMQNGQPIPDQLLKEQTPDDQETYKKGMRQLFLGVGLMVFLGITVGKVGLGIGALVFFIGLGKVLIARKAQKNPDPFIQN
jgi:hypothetical protein